VADQSGAKSQMTGLVGAGLVAVLLLFLNGLLADLPQTALAAVVITAALSLMDLGALRRFAQVRTSSLVVSLVATAGVIFLGVLQGIIVAIVLIVVLFFHRGWRPHGAVLGYVPGLGGWHSISKYPEATELPGVVVFRWEAPLFFANSGQFRSQVRKLVRERNPSWIVLQCEAITDIDVTAAEVLKVLDEELNDRGVHLAFVELRDRLQDLVRRYGLHTTLDQEHIYPNIAQALDEIANVAQDDPRPHDEGTTPP
jgi:MFS superfamily sulfate permease-like transporter